MYSRWIFLKKANCYDNSDCFPIVIAKPVVGTAEKSAEPDYDAIKRAATSSVNENLKETYFAYTIYTGSILNMFSVISVCVDAS